MLVRVFHLAVSRLWRPPGSTMNYHKRDSSLPTQHGDGNLCFLLGFSSYKPEPKVVHNPMVSIIFQ